MGEINDNLFQRIKKKLYKKLYHEDSKIKIYNWYLFFNSIFFIICFIVAMATRTPNKKDLLNSFFVVFAFFSFIANFYVWFLKKYRLRKLRKKANMLSKKNEDDKKNDKNDKSRY